MKIYIRKENLAKWLSIESPAEWINAILANSDDTSQYGKLKQTPVGPVRTVLSEKLPERFPNADEFMASKGIKPESVYTTQNRHLNIYQQAEAHGYKWDPTIKQVVDPGDGSVIPHKLDDGELVIL